MGFEYVDVVLVVVLNIWMLSVGVECLDVVCLCGC